VNRRAGSDRAVDPDPATDLVNGSLARRKTDPQTDPFPGRLLRETELEYLRQHIFWYAGPAVGDSDQAPFRS